ncbi:DEAD/DEAH box helicase [Aporhodopirellula aestuarii]|uniref:ATP-dependent RNA helicase DeaD n=1 Tax=Aporhodopirellula aestuarii TaxID=2950107 RepID=A0ABT0U1I8_9BACT|nr:DEAD/DEAH box helicase [Aporhodopirellula aestuarii]MCM2370509.1 DEAD/DEAH box helicase [Aporhodopirellula aestuarii]
MSSQFPNSENPVLSEQNPSNDPILIAEHDQFEESSVHVAPATHDALLACYTQDTIVECLATPAALDNEVVCSAPTADLNDDETAQYAATTTQPTNETVEAESVVEESAVNEPVAQEPFVSEPVMADPVVVEPAVVEPAVLEAVAAEVITAEASAVETVVDTTETNVTETEEAAAAIVDSQPVAVEPSVSEPAASEPVASEPATSEAKVVTAKVKAKAKPEPEAERVIDPETETEANAGFAAFPLRSEVLAAVAKSGYDTPTAIQAEIIPHMLEGRDVLAQSQTGTGKTAAFALPILTTIDTSKYHPQVLVLAPTRELAIQVARSFSTYGATIPGFAVAAIYGGQDYEPQLKQLRRGVQVVVGTPGRVIDHVNRGTLDLAKLDCLVLDEADEMLNMGFLEDVQFVLEKTPVTRQVALFSATLPGPIRDIADEYLKSPARITIKKKTATADSIRQRAIFVSPRDKIDALVRLLEVEETDGVIVFTKTKDATISVAESLTREGLSAVALNGDMPQKVRERTISQLKNGKLDILVATDVAARGLDVPRISHVFNFDLPHDSESYIHRVGRTGRAGRDGEAIIFLTNAQRTKLRHIERATKQPIEIVGIPTAKEINAMRVKRFGQQITEAAAEKDLTLFKDLIASYAEESGKPLDMIAAALAEISLRGRPFLMKDRPATARSEREGRFDRGDHYGDGDRGGSHMRSGKPQRQLGPPREGMVRYRIEVGWQDGVKPGNIVGAVANEAGIEGQYIGPINIRDDFSTIDLPEGMPSDIYQKLRKTWVSGKRLNLEVARDTDSDDGSRGGFQRGGGNRPGGFRAKNTKGGPHGAKRTFAGKPKKNKRKSKP